MSPPAQPLGLEAIYARALQPYSAPFEPQALMAEAEEATGLRDWGGARWGEPGFHRRMQALCASLESEARLSAPGRTRAHCRLHVMLCSRLRYIAFRRSWSGERPIVAPLVGTGFPRAGTSFLHQVLAQDPENLSASTAQCAIPVPIPAESRGEDERNALTARLLSFQALDTPEVEAVHPFAADAPDECLAMQECGCGTVYQAFFDVPGFMAVASADIAELFDWQKQLMQALQAGRSANRWVLKTPEHMHNWAPMLQAFPDARVFLNHRDPARVMPSIASLFMTFRGMNSAGSLDPKLLGPALLPRLAASMDRVSAWRKAHPEVKVVDVHYKDLTADPIGEAERVYAEFGLQLSPTARERMAKFLGVNRHGQGPAHRYTLADFGLDETAVEAVCGRYIDEYRVAREARR